MEMEWHHETFILRCKSIDGRIPTLSPFFQGVVEAHQYSFINVWVILAVICLLGGVLTFSTYTKSNAAVFVECSHKANFNSIYCYLLTQL
jgi:hypothetical protein